MKRLIGLVLLILAAGGFFAAGKDVVEMHGRRNAGEKAVELSENDQETVEKTCTAEVNFFYGSAECPTCDIIKEEAFEVIDTLEEGDIKGPVPAITWSEMNVEEPGNEQYILDYGLYTTTIVLADRRNPERWKRLDEVWDLASDRNRLFDFLRREILEFAEGCAS
ncbi:MAG: nitrophenyl compound nitroreductase subunit ArsF family protein [Thermovirgaceae bacterium]